MGHVNEDSYVTWAKIYFAYLTARHYLAWFTSKNNTFESFGLLFSHYFLVAIEEMKELLDIENTYLREFLHVWKTKSKSTPK